MNSEISQTSRKISQLPAGRIHADNWLVFEKPGESSFRIKYSDFRADVIRRLDSMLKFGTMASQDKENFSYFAHGHDYSDVRFFPSYGKDSENPNYPDNSNCVKIGEFKTVVYGHADTLSSKTVDVCVPYMPSGLQNDLSSWRPWKVGDIQSICVENLRTYLTSVRGYEIKRYPDGTENIDIEAAGFDGYVIPNGTMFTCRPDEFQTACRMWSSTKQSNSTSFRVPSLNGFVRANDNCDFRLDVNEMSAVQHMSALAEHDHGNFLVDGITELSIEIPPFRQGFTSFSSTTTDHGTVHASNSTEYVPKNPNNVPILSIEFIRIDDIETLGYNCTYEGTDVVGETSPAFNYVPALIYIGRAFE